MTTPHGDALRRSPLDAKHRAMGASMTAFGGWDMPLDYGSVVSEHRTVRDRCGVFDLSHLGTLTVTGADAESVVQHAFTNDVAALAVGRAHYSLCLADDGGIVDDLLVYRLEWGYFVVPNAANAARVRALVEASAAGHDCAVGDVKDDLACLAVQGPESADVLTSCGLSITGMGYLDCRVLDVASSGPSSSGTGTADALPGGGLLARSGYTGERGYEVFVSAERSVDLWDKVLGAGAEPVGLGARDTLRLEMGYPLHGADISPEVSPVEARLGWAVKPGTGFRGEEAYVSAVEAGPARRLIGLRATGRGIPRAGCVVLHGGEEAGRVTSGTFSPTLRIGVALAFLDPGLEVGERVQIDVRGKHMEAEVTRPPFVDADPRA